jgi:hypothetical protein
MNHFISLDEAIKMTGLYRQHKENILSGEFKGKNILSFSETFDAEAFRTILNKKGCKSLRIYFGMSEDKKVHAIIVGVNENNEDMLPSAKESPGSTANLTVGEIIEQGQLCPPVCPAVSPLNP